MASPRMNSAAAMRRKVSDPRHWLIVSESGNSHVEEVGKYSIMRRTGLPASDLRVLDPVLLHPSTIFGRERAIVVNLEHVRVIITASEILMIHSTHPLVLQFVADLLDNLQSEEVEGDPDATPDLAPGGGGPKFLLPFEFKALEVCLESCCRCLESESQTLEDEACQALDELTKQISTRNLERVKQIKSRLVDISGRVQKVRDELEHLSDDDNNMAGMYLTEKLAYEESEAEHSQNNSDICHISTVVKPNIVELENLLEAYIVQIDGISQKLANLNEYVDDTHDFINIMLDDKQNQLLQTGVKLSTGNVILNAGIVVSGLFGMNIIQIEPNKNQFKTFWEIVFGTLGGCLVLYLIAAVWGKKRSLI